MKWEYLSTTDESKLEDLGDKGWELVAIVPDNNPRSGLMLYLKRPKKPYRPSYAE